MLGLGSGGFDVLYVNLTRGLGLAAGARRARDEAAVHAGAGTPCATRRRTAARADSLDGHAGRLLHAPHAGRAGRARGSRGSRVAYVQLAGGALPVVAVGHRARAEGARAPRRGGRCRRLFRTATSSASMSRPRSPGPRRRIRRGRLRRSGRGSSAPAPRSGTARSRRRRRRTRRSASAARPVLARARLGRRPARAPRGVSHHARAVLELARRCRRSPGRTGRPRHRTWLERARRSTLRLARGVRRAPARPHGPRPGRRPRVLAAAYALAWPRGLVPKSA